MALTTASAATRKVHTRLSGELSPWLLATYGLAIFLSGLYFGRYSGEFRGDSLDPVSELPVTQMPVQAIKAEAAEVQIGAPLEQVIIRNLQFQPATLEVRKGETVEWKNADLTPHTATLDRLSPANRGGTLSPKRETSPTFAPSIRR